MASKKYIFQFTLADGTTHSIPIEIPVGEPGGYYLPVLRQISDTTIEVSYTPSNPDMPPVQPVTITIPVSGDSGGNVEPMEDDIPKVFFGGALPQTKDDTIMSFRYISKTKDISGYCKTKAQGNSSMAHPKKNQTVKLYTDAECTEKLKVNFKGWGEQNKFCFKANWIDLTHARNVVSARLWGNVVKSRANYAQIPELLRTSPNHGAVDGFPVKVYADGVYQGRYTLNIPKDAWMANMDDELDNHCILCGENYVSGCFRAEANIDESDWTDEVHDIVPASIKNRWNEAIHFIMNSTDEEFVTGIGTYFDVESLIDYYLFGLASCGLDAFGKNQLYMTYDGQKWYATMYDMDSTWGLWWTGESFVPSSYSRQEYQDFKDGDGNLLYIRLEALFSDSIKERWETLKNGALSISNLINRFERFTDIVPPYLVEEDYAESTADGAFVAIPSQTTNNIQQIRAFARERYNWTNGYLTRAGSIGLVNGVFENEHFNITVTNGNHVAIEKLSTPNTSINGPISDIRMMQDVGSTEIGNMAHDAIFTIPANGTITVNIKNSTIDTEYVWVECTVFLVKPDGTSYGNATVSSLADHWNQSYFTGSVTVPSDTEIGALGLYVGRTEQTFSVEFDLEVFVNGEQYV